MKIFKNFSAYSPETRTLPDNVIYLHSAEGEDWYALQSQFADNTLKVAYNADGVICSAHQDGSMLWPVGLSVAEVNLPDVPAGFDIYGGWVYDGENIQARTYTQAEHIAKAEIEKANLLNAINNKTQLWHTQLMLGMITDADKQTLTDWMKYSQAVQAIDTRTAPTLTWPTSPAK